MNEGGWIHMLVWTNWKLLSIDPCTVPYFHIMSNIIMCNVCMVGNVMWVCHYAFFSTMISRNINSIFCKKLERTLLANYWLLQNRVSIHTIAYILCKHTHCFCPSSSFPSTLCKLCIMKASVYIFLHVSGWSLSLSRTPLYCIISFIFKKYCTWSKSIVL